MRNTLKKLDAFFDHHAAILVIISLILFLRLPNLSEPYWYGDEAIYLTIGQALNKGYTLYSQIIDHKTPIIYYLARVGTQFNFRVLNMMWTAASAVLFYILAMNLFGRRKHATIATALFALLTTLPWFEGHIPNGELFVIGFVLAGAAVLTKTAYWQSFFTDQLSSDQSKKETKYLLLAGVCFGLAILTKVPAIFDVAAFASIGYFSLSSIVLARTSTRAEMIKHLRRAAQPIVLLLVGVAIPIALSILYFVTKGAGDAYLQFGLLYNFRYAGSWQLDIASPILAFFFTLPGKVTFLVLIAAALTLFQKRLSAVATFSLIWFALALVATLLSNRPYPHYFIQLVPPFALVTTVAYVDCMAALATLRSRKKTSFQSATPFFSLLLCIGGIGLTAWLLYFLQVRPYAVASYYQNWWQFITKKVSQDEYRATFNGLNQDNYKLARLLKSTSEDKLFIWGTNPMLYALSRATPTGRFTVAFHIKDFDAYDETYNDLVADAPEYVVVMNDERTSFPRLQHYLNAYYIPSIEEYTHFVVWKRLKK